MVVLCGIVVFASGLIGYIISKKLTKKATFYKNMCSFCEKLEINIAFLQNTLPEILNKIIKENNAEIGPLVSSFKDYINNKQSSVLFPSYLKDAEKEEINNFIKAVGNGPSALEEKLIMGFKAQMESRLKTAEYNKAKNGPLLFKLTTFIGLALAIIIY